MEPSGGIFGRRPSGITTFPNRALTPACSGNVHDTRIQVTQEFESYIHDDQGIVGVVRWQAITTVNRLRSQQEDETAEHYRAHGFEMRSELRLVGAVPSASPPMTESETAGIEATETGPPPPRGTR